ncbi:MAG TPA: DsbC family protein, partial [Verrucomicrobiae bacterium]|nr:DsbC family protein [Verrucomicrobiae bacterium]
MNPKAFFFLLFFLACSNSYAMPLSDRGGAACSSCHVLTLQEAKNLVAGIGAEVKDVKPAAVGGLWELLLEKDGQQAAAYVDYT